VYVMFEARSYRGIYEIRAPEFSTPMTFDKNARDKTAEIRYAGS
jgi:hypothetical protein